jgi:hypothetical protein
MTFFVHLNKDSNKKKSFLSSALTLNVYFLTLKYRVGFKITSGSYENIFILN